MVSIAFAKSFDSCQPAQSAQADMGRNLSLFSIILHVKGPFYIMIQSVVRNDNGFMNEN